MDEKYLERLTPLELFELKHAVKNNIYSDKLQGLSDNEIEELEELLESDPFASMVATYEESFNDNIL